MLLLADFFNVISSMFNGANSSIQKLFAIFDENKPPLVGHSVFVFFGVLVEKSSALLVKNQITSSRLGNF